MKALCWHGKKNVSVDNVPDPKILNDRDIILKITKTAICGSDLHLYNAMIPSMKPGDILGHEFMGVVEELGKGVTNLKKGDRVVIPFTIACGACFFCTRDLWSLCDNSNPNAGMVEAINGYSGSALFGYSHLFGGYAGGQAEYVRVPFADVGPYKVPDSVTDEQALLTTDIFPTGYMAAENCNIQPGDTVAIWGCGPVGLMAIKSAFLLGAERVIAIDHIPERLALARDACGAEIIDYKDGDVGNQLKEKTNGLGPDSVMDAVGLEAHGNSLDNLLDKALHAARLITDRPHVLREAILACRKGGYVSLPGVYGGFVNQIPLGAAHAKGLTIKMGQTHVHKYLPILMDHIEKGRVDCTFMYSHRLPLSEAAHGYDIFTRKVDGATKIVLSP